MSYSATWEGLEIRGTVEVERRTYDYPGGTWVEVESILPADDDPEALERLEEDGLGGAARIARGWVRLFGKLPPAVEAWIWARCDDQIETALIEEAAADDRDEYDYPEWDND